MKERKEDVWDTTVVTLDDFSFRYLKKNLEYSFPASSKRKLFDYLAIYRLKPVSAITHYAPIKELIRDSDIDGKYRLLTFGDKARDAGIKVLVERLIELNEPVKMKEKQSIQGVYYTNLEYIKRSRDIKELFSYRDD